jgi:metallo-beta-lactamase family protein
MIDCGLFQGSQKLENSNRLPTTAAMQQLDHLPDPTTLVLMVGYQSRGSVGRAIADGAKAVRIGGRQVSVQAKTHQLGGLSGHAGQSDLLDWFGSLAAGRPGVILTHGEDPQRRALAACIQQRFDLTPEMPASRQVVEL